MGLKTITIYTISLALQNPAQIYIIAEFLLEDLKQLPGKKQKTPKRSTACPKRNHEL